ncbi:MAG: hypothetical protein J5748_00380 [Bacteroidales bacterium]|nr:hypothetical protein [Bacteroidales bacterium]
MIRKVYLPETGFKAADIPELFQEEGISYEKIDVLNWPGQFPYKPLVEFAMAHTGDKILLHYRVVEKTSRAAAGEDGGNVWEDSCVEFFSSTDGKVYYNLECNCIGKILLAKGEGRNDRVKAPSEITNLIDRWSSLGDKPFAEKQAGPWEVCLIIPAEALNLESFDALQIKANFYKCGDLLETPHFLSYAPIDTPNPDFHRPEFFIPVAFE